MSLDHRLIDLLVCPVCKGPLQMARDPQGRPTELQCPADRLAFPIRDGVPMLVICGGVRNDIPWQYQLHQMDLHQFMKGLTKATFSGLIMDLIATGDRKRLTTASVFLAAAETD